MKSPVFLGFLLLVIGCGNSDRIPSDIIPKDSMQHVLWDMIQADQYAKQFFKKDTARVKNRVETMRLYQEVFELHHITKDQFQRSYQFYVSRPDLIKTIFDSLASSANRRRQEIYKPKPILKHLPG